MQAVLQTPHAAISNQQTRTKAERIAAAVQTTANPPEFAEDSIQERFSSPNVHAKQARDESDRHKNRSDA